MNFDLTDDQRLLQESVRRLLANTYDFQRRAEYVEMPDGWSRDQWSRYAEMGLLGLPFDEDHRGFGGGPVEIMIVMEEMGRALTLEPFFSTVLLCGTIIQEAGDQEQKSDLIPRIIDGSLLLAFAQAEPGAHFDLDRVDTRARRSGPDWIIEGHKRHVLDGASADMLLVTARIEADDAADGEIGLFLVPADDPKVERRGYPLQDGSRACEVWFREVFVEARHQFVAKGETQRLVQRVTNRAIAAKCCEAVGAMARAQEMTLEYLKVREQFGIPLGANQALRHRAVDMFVELEMARSIAMYGIIYSASADLDVATRAASAAKIQIGRASRLIGQESIQLHGGIGMTDEYPAGHYFRRLTMIEMLFGNTHFHLGKLAEIGGLGESEDDVPENAC